jgi:hypothetical protein
VPYGGSVEPRSHIMSYGGSASARNRKYNLDGKKLNKHFICLSAYSNL